MISKKKQEQIDEHLNTPLKVGEDVCVRGLGIQDKSRWGNSTEVIEINDDESILIKQYGHSNQTIQKENYKKVLYDIGIDPFPKTRDLIRSVNFQLETIMYTLGLMEYEKERYDIKGVPIKRGNFNPIVFDKEGNKVYYQRPLVWTDDDKRLLIDSIYANIDCGKVLVRKRSWEELEMLVEKGETDIAFNDVVDGKQRLNAIKDFIEDKFSDSYGNYYSDLSDNAQRRLLNHQLISYSELPENCSDEAVKEQFLKLNFAGVPQSKEHIEFVKSIKL